MNTVDNNEQINVTEVFRRILRKKWFILKSLIIAFVLACIIIVPVPRYYTSSVELAPELGNLNAKGGDIADIASSMGFNLNATMLSDAISPELYPKLLQSNNFVVSLINCPVKTADGGIKTTYYRYLEKHQKQNPLTVPFGAITKLFKKKQPADRKNQPVNPFKLTERQDEIFELMKSKIKCSVDKKTNLITITVKDQDPLIAATMNDMVRQKLQQFIAQYRTNKARNDMEYYKGLTAKAKETYERARRLYSSYSDANMDIVLQSFKSKQEDLENDMQLKFNAYNSLNTQLLNAVAKVQEKTPAFTIVKAASVPIKPAGPRRMLFVLGVVLIVFIGSSVYVSKDLVF